MQCLDGCSAPKGMTRSSCLPCQFLSRSQRAIPGEMALVYRTHKPLTPKASGSDRV